MGSVLVALVGCSGDDASTVETSTDAGSDAATTDASNTDGASTRETGDDAVSDGDADPCGASFATDVYGRWRVDLAEPR